MLFVASLFANAVQVPWMVDFVRHLDFPQTGCQEDKALSSPYQ